MANASTANISGSLLPAGAWRHMAAGALGGMCGAIVTSPFDVVKTRLQSDLFRAKNVGVGPTMGVVRAGMNGTVTVVAAPRVGGLLWHFIETGYIIRDIYVHESPRALFKGLGATLVGVIPARAINFFSYGNGKQIIANNFNNGKENSLVHLSAAAMAGIITGSVTNPIWVVKTRLQLVVDAAAQADAQRRPVQSSSSSSSSVMGSQTRSMLGGSVRTIKQIFREQGIKGFYKGLSASYLGVTEGTIQWVLYERLKLLTTKIEDHGVLGNLLGILCSAGTAKGVASLITYPHEVLRTRLRQPMVNGVPKYTGLVQTLRLVIKEEGARALYGGLSAHLIKVMPNAAVMFWIYEGAKNWGRT